MTRMLRFRRIVSAIALTIAVAMLSGCAFGLGTVEDMLSPPKLTDEQSAIYKALTDSKGVGVKLKYPKSGEHRSAFVVYGDDKDAAIVFYEISGANLPRSLWVNFLFKNDDVWESLYDISLEDGTDVEFVSFEEFGEDGEAVLIISYPISQNEKKLMVISNIDKTPVKQFDAFYSFMAVDYFFGKDRKELMLIRNYRSIPSAEATFYNIIDGQLLIDVWCELDPSAGEYTGMLQGDIVDGLNALFINHRKYDNPDNYGTDILYYSGARLRNPMILEPENIARSLRMTGPVTEPANPTDIDGDGIIEVPSSTGEFPGYGNLPGSEKLRPVIWRVLENGRLEDRHYSYYSEACDYVFFLPPRWIGSVTAKALPDEHIVSFYRAGAAIDEIDEDDLLLSIKTVFPHESALPDLSEWERFAADKRVSPLWYYIKTANEDDPLSLTAEELEFAFRILDGLNVE